MLPDPHAYAVFRNDYEAGIAHQSGFQKHLRKDHLANAMERILISTGAGIQAATTLDLSEPEVYWRADCLLVWSEAIVARNPSSRDYYDWLAPYLKPDAFAERDYPSFWLQDVQTNDTPKNRLASLIAFYQLEAKITHGNAEDSQHACHALDVDSFLTADVAFYNTLRKVADHFRRFASIHLVDRSAPSTMPFVQEALRVR